MHLRILLCAMYLSATATAAPVLDHRKLLEAESFWDNRDFPWFEENIPFLDTPDAALNATYYYRWELLTKHLTYGSPDTGYVFTEFIDRPFWSGTYGAISCPSGHQFYEARWLRNPRYSHDYARYWFRTPGAQPRRYSAWMADSAWATHQVHPDPQFLTDLLPDLLENFKEWEKRHWVEDVGLFWQVGHDDGMEYNIASRQTQNLVAGAPSYRPSFNAYMWADQVAISKMARLTGNEELAAQFAGKSAKLKETLQAKLWDPKREFFFPMFRDTENDKEGFTVEKNTLMYQSGKFAGSPHGREEAGYVPWAFGMPDDAFDAAWKFLMDPAYFFAPYGPTTVERNDPMFLLSPTCCWWSGQSWPFATTQTLKGMANRLHRSGTEEISRQEYFKLLSVYSNSHRKDGKPYIAEALHPFTGSWAGHDAYYHSEHYFHSGFVDLVVTGLIGLQVADDETLTVDPLAPDEWPYFAMDNILYRGNDIAILWDRTGGRYGKGTGFKILVNGEITASADAPCKLTVKLPLRAATVRQPDRRVNHAVNNDGNWYPRLTASHVGPRSSLAFLQDGNTAWYHLHPPLRWTSEGSPNDVDWIEMDFGMARRINEIRLYLLDDGGDRPVTSPISYQVQIPDSAGAWQDLPGQQRVPTEPTGHMPNKIAFPELETQRLRIELRHAPGKKSGLTEIEAWGPAALPYQVAAPPAGNLAFNPNPADRPPHIRASFSDRFGGTPERAIDGKIFHRKHPMNRWTSYGSPNPSDWLELDFGRETRVARVVMHIYSDGGGVKAPESYKIESWSGDEWQEIPHQVKQPAIPTGGMANTVTFPVISTAKLRVVFEHAGNDETRSGVTELEVWEQ